MVTNHLQPINPSETVNESVPMSSTVNKHRNVLAIIFGTIVVIGAVGTVIYYLSISKNKSFIDTSSQQDSSSSTPANSLGQIEESQPISLSDYKEEGPTIIEQTYPKERVNVGGQKYNATQIIILARLFISEEDDYSILSSFDHVGSLTTIDGVQGLSYESVFHLTPGNHSVEIKYINGQCLDRAYLEKTYGIEAKPLSIYFSIRKKSVKQTIPNYTMFDNGIEITTESRPYKKTDLYLHCQTS
jgi:hypothetical protein